MINLGSYLKNRDIEFKADYTLPIQENAKETVRIVNELLQDFADSTGIILSDCASGWRPAGINDHVSGAAHHSRHISAEACDIRDTPGRALAKWVASNQDRLESLGLYCERFEWTPTWVHFQTVPVPSGHRFFIPSSAPGLIARMPEQDQYNC